METHIRDSINKLDKIQAELASFHVERDLEIRGMMLALIANTNILLLGEPGVGKSRLVNDVSRHIKDARHFSWLLSQFTVPDELAGPPSLKSLEEDKFARRTAGMLPEAHTAFLDEIWKCNSGTNNFLLPMLNERVFYNEGKAIPIPLMMVAAASNELPEEGDGLDAALDRFVLKFYVNTVKEKANLIKMMNNFLAFDPNKEITQITIEEIKRLQEVSRDVEVPMGIKKLILDFKNDLEKEHIFISPRVINQSLRILQAEALLNKREQVAEDDLEVLRHTFWKEPEKEPVIYAKILARISPDKERLQELFGEAEELYRDYRGLDLDSDSAAQVAIQHAQSLSRIKDKINKVRKNIKEKGKSTSQAEKMIVTIEAYIKEICNDGLSVNFIP